MCDAMSNFQFAVSDAGYAEDFELYIEIGAPTDGVFTFIVRDKNEGGLIVGAFVNGDFENAPRLETDSIREARLAYAHAYMSFALGATS